MGGYSALFLALVFRTLIKARSARFARVHYCLGEDYSSSGVLQEIKRLRLFILIENMLAVVCALSWLLEWTILNSPAVVAVCDAGVKPVELLILAVLVCAVAWRAPGRDSADGSSRVEFSALLIWASEDSAVTGKRADVSGASADIGWRATVCVI